MTYLSIQVMKLFRIAYDIRLPKIRVHTPGSAVSASSQLNRPGSQFGLSSLSGVGQDRSVQTSGPSSTAEQGTHQKRWQRRVTFDCEPGELRET